MNAFNDSCSEFKNLVQDWIVDLAKEAGLDISGFRHKNKVC